ncbi:5-(carboxyamino)imidazole ribonucleotide synthase [Sporolactobacillus inulinus]|jgi:5-(carboxyamino)imidazole ribonucleotide synthase|uniref:N5-carboxyaminoimidazole ribonucleotide synthase n=2 Tax=Sporolactobacillus inulinus TaxID=2078 RepID=A0A0U1QML1_9BACL|nr:5-(carboxyamino)imidazole ribonucleotide synthase [Sporolactobacillus inulinus]KLI02039.1 phosphoribosylaminoimidazole carboxylase [Sporolactobacillus inulinus CASD]GEB77326.1 N5-carboxyaminoimidazole ribonucleotide synthase [Sporolactobacillus inulinus]
MNQKTILPGQTIGILGGGQLGRMMAISAKQMGYRIAVLDPVEDCPCAQVADIAITANYDDPEAAKKMATVADVVTYEFENVDVQTVDYLQENSYLPQGGHLLEITKDRLNEKAAIQSAGLPVAPYMPVRNTKELEEAIDTIGFPSVLKTTQGGYDGKGQYVLKSKADLEEALPYIGKTPFELEKWLPFEKEISVIVARSTTGETSVFPVAENIHRHNILHHTLVPARISDNLREEATQHALRLAEALHLVGTLAVEMFVGTDGRVYVNETAPRPHNSGHFSINACETSQFEQHIRAICGLPLASAQLLKPVIMVNILGQHVQPVLDKISELSSAHLHLYGKDAAKTGRKMGHLTILGDTVDEAIEKAEQIGIWKIEQEVGKHS